MEVRVTISGELLFHTIAQLHIAIERDKKELDGNKYSEMYIQSKRRAIDLSERALKALSPLTHHPSPRG